MQASTQPSRRHTESRPVVRPQNRGTVRSNELLTSDASLVTRLRVSERMLGARGGRRLTAEGEGLESYGFWCIPDAILDVRVWVKL